MSRTVGFELEFADLNTWEAVKIVAEKQGKDPEEWQDRFGGYTKPKLSYDSWNVMSDGSIRNSDGSRCMFNYRNEEGELVTLSSSKKSEGHRLWLGTELISPVFTVDQDRIYYELSSILKDFREAGAKVTRSSLCALHVHVDVSDLSFEKIKKAPRYFMSIQDQLSPLMIDLSPVRRRMPLYNEEFVESLEWSGDKASFLRKYFDYKGKIRDGGQYAVRRLIDVSPAVDPAKSYNTFEFRCFTSTLNPEVVRVATELSHSLVQDFVSFGTTDIEKYRDEITFLENNRYKEEDDA